MKRLVSKAELLWLLDAIGPAETSDLAAILPINHNSVYVRLRHLKRSGYLEVDKETSTGPAYEWALTDAGRERLVASELPDPTTVDFETYFANRAHEIDPLMILEVLSVQEEEWNSSSIVHEALPFTKPGIRKRLHKLEEEGALELNPGKPGLAHQWRLTDAGRQQLAEADDREAGGDREYAWLDT